MCRVVPLLHECSVKFKMSCTVIEDEIPMGEDANDVNEAVHRQQRQPQENALGDTENN